MKNILITGANSYIGTSFEQYLAQWPEEYRVTTVDMLDGAWREQSFADYDAVFHVAGIAHQKETAENAPLYYTVNRDLAIEVAQKAKADGVPHFVFMSSMSVYGTDVGEITPATVPAPKSHYGKSKRQAEEALEAMADDAFRIAILRPPMVYGKDCRGNFQLLLKLVQKSPVFPAVNNQRSMISMTNLCAFVRLVVDEGHAGVFCPQNREYVNTTDMAKLMANALGRKVWFSRLAGVAINIMMPFVSKVKKAFGSLTYKDCEPFDFCYCEESFSDSVTRSV